MSDYTYLVLYEITKETQGKLKKILNSLKPNISVEEMKWLRENCPAWTSPEWDKISAGEPIRTSCRIHEVLDAKQGEERRHPIVGLEERDLREIAKILNIEIPWISTVQEILEIIFERRKKIEEDKKNLSG